MSTPTHPCQIEVPVTDLERARDFYGAVLGWVPTPADLHEVIVIDVPADCPWGISLIRKSGHLAGEGPTLFWRVGDPEAALAATVKFGGKILQGPQRHPGYGRAWRICDPDGNAWGIFTPA